jgi:hypothetical protein
LSTVCKLFHDVICKNCSETLFGSHLSIKRKVLRVNPKPENNGR